MSFGESLEQIAAARKIPAARIVELNAIAPGEVVRGGTVLLVPRAPASSAARARRRPTRPLASTPDAAKPVVVIPQDMFVYPDRKRVFYRVLTGDTLPEIAKPPPRRRRRRPALE